MIGALSTIVSPRESRNRSGNVTVTKSGAVREVPFTENGPPSWFVEEGTTNYVRTGDWSPSIDASFTRELISERVWRVTRVAGGGYAYIFTNPENRNVVLNDPETASWEMKVTRASGSVNPNHAQLQLWGSPSGSRATFGTSSTTTLLKTLPDGWGRYSTTILWNNTITNGTAGSRVIVSNLIGYIGDYVDVRFPQIEPKAYATSFASGSMGTGYSWTGATGLSPSTRAYSYISAPIPSDVSSALGGLYVRTSRPDYAKAVGSQRIFRSGSFTGSTWSIGTSIDSSNAVNFQMNYGGGTTSTARTSLPNTPNVSIYSGWEPTSMYQTIGGAKKTAARSGVGGWNSPIVYLGGYSGSQMSNINVFAALFFRRHLTDPEIAFLDSIPDYALTFAEVSGEYTPTACTPRTRFYREGNDTRCYFSFSFPTEEEVTHFKVKTIVGGVETIRYVPVTTTGGDVDPTFYGMEDYGIASYSSMSAGQYAGSTLLLEGVLPTDYIAILACTRSGKITRWVVNDRKVPALAVTPDVKRSYLYPHLVEVLLSPSIERKKVNDKQAWRVNSS